MKFTQEIEINKPIDQVVKLFDNQDNMKHWQEGFISIEPVSGTPGNVGAKSILRYKMGSRKVEMIETITVRNLPDEFSGTYEAKGIWNEVKNYFTSKNPDKTLWRCENEFKGSGFMKIILFLLPGSFRKQSFKYMVAFKRFAEEQT